MDTLLLSVIAVVLFFSSLNIYFVSDNISHITNAAQNFKDFDYRYFRPLPVLSLYLDSIIWGANYSGYHLTNLLIHLLNALLIYFLAKLLLNQRFFAFSAALLFLLHPIHSLPIFWISGRTDMICALFYLAATGSFIRFRQTGRQAYLAASTLIFILAMLSKEMAASLPLILGVYVLIFDRQNSIKLRIKKAFYTTLPHWGFLLIYGVMRFSFIGKNVFGNTDHSLRSPLQLIKNTAVYLGLMIVPGGHIEIANYLKAHPAIFLFFSLLGLAVLIFSFRWVKKFRLLLFFLVFILISLLPVLRLVMRWYLYIPSVGFSMAIAYLLYKIYRPERDWRQLSTALLLIVSLIYTIFIYQEQNRWLAAGQFSREFTGKLANAIAEKHIKSCYLLNVPGELQEVPVAIYGLEPFINFRLANEFDHPQPVIIRSVARLSLSTSADIHLQTVRKVSAHGYELSSEKSAAHYFFLHSDLRNHHLREGMKITGAGFQQRIEKINERGEVIKMSVDFEDNGVPVLYFSRTKILVD